MVNAAGEVTDTFMNLTRVIQGDAAVVEDQIRFFKNNIPLSVRAAEISAIGVSIYEHDPKGRVAEAYQSLTKEVLAG